MDSNEIISDFQRICEDLRVPLILTGPNLVITYANQASRDVLPITLEYGKRLQVEGFLEGEDSGTFQRVVSECRLRGESVCTVKQKGTARFYRVRAYKLKHCKRQMVFQLEDISGLRFLEDQFYDHLVDLYSQLETKEREITDLRATLLRVQGN